MALKGFTLSALALAVGIATSVQAEEWDESMQDVSSFSVTEADLQLAEDRRKVTAYLMKKGVPVNDWYIDQVIENDPQLSFLNDEEHERSSSMEEILSDGTGSAKFEVVGQETIMGDIKASIYAHKNAAPDGAGPEGLLSYSWGSGWVQGSAGGYFRNNDGRVVGEAASTGVTLIIPHSHGLYGSTTMPEDPGGFGVHYGVYGSATVNLAPSQDAGALQNYGVYGTTNQPTGFGGYFVNTYDVNPSGANDYAQALYAKGDGKDDYRSEDPRAYVATIEATNSLDTSGLAVFLNNQAAGNFDDYIGFITRNRAGDANHFAGSIRGVSGGTENGVQLVSNAADFAEFLARANPDESIEAGDVVGVVNGKISRNLAGAHSIQVVSSAPIVVGNMPERDKEHLYEPVAFVGQVPVKVVGKVQTGDYIVASGKNDGTAIAVPEDMMTPEQFRMVVGRAWASSNQEGGKLINTAIGLASSGAYAYMKKQDQRIASLEQQLNAKVARLEHLAARLEMLTQKVAYIQASNTLAKVSAQ